MRFSAMIYYIACATATVAAAHAHAADDMKDD